MSDPTVDNVNEQARTGERGKMYHWCANMKGGKK